MDYVDIVTIFYPLSIQSKFFGYNLFHLPKSSKTINVSIKASDIFLVISHIVIYFWLFLSINSQSENSVIFRNILFHITRKTGSLIMEFLGRILFNIVGTANIIATTMDFINRNKVWKILCEIRNFDAKVRILGYHRRHI